MGVSLSTPITNLHIEREVSDHVSAAVCALQGFRSNMEDEHNMVLKLNDSGMMLFGVYDGHGGREAATYLYRHLPEALAEIENLDEKNTDHITEIMLDLDNNFLNSGKEDGSACTFVLVQLYHKKDNTPIPADEIDTFLRERSDECHYKCLAVNIGDSRSMISRGDDDYVAMTEDHKPNDPHETARIVRAGGHVQHSRVDGNLALSRAFGDLPYKTGPMSQRDQKVIVVPDYQVHYITPGDILIVCCDGIYESPMMTHKEVSEFVQGTIKGAKTEEQPMADGALIARDLIHQSLIMDSRDNHTAMIIQFGDIPQYIKDLPQREVVPGPYKINMPSDYIRSYETDMVSFDYEMRDVVPLIEKYHGSMDDPDDVPDLSQFPIPPIIIGGGDSDDDDNEERMDAIKQLVHYMQFVQDEDFDENDYQL